MSYGSHTRNPVEIDETPESDDSRFLCGCGDSRCWLVGDDASNVNIGGTWFSCDCAAICFFCGEQDDLRNVQRISGSWLAHEGCLAADPAIGAELDRQARADEQRESFEQRRR